MSPMWGGLGKGGDRQENQVMTAGHVLWEHLGLGLGDRLCTQEGRRLEPGGACRPSRWYLILGERRDGSEGIWNVRLSGNVALEGHTPRPVSANTLPTVSNSNLSATPHHSIPI